MREAQADRMATYLKGKNASIYIHAHETYDHTGLGLVKECHLPNYYPDLQTFPS